MKTIFTTITVLSSLFYLVHSSKAFAQDKEFDYVLVRDSIDKMNLDELKIFIDNGFDFNISLGNKYIHRLTEEPADNTLFQQFVGYYGFHCDTTDIEKIYFILEHNKYPLSDPLWFMDDACDNLIIDILEYFTAARKNNPEELNEQEFMYVVHNFYAHENYENPNKNHKNIVGKTVLMYAVEFGFIHSVEYLLRCKVDLESKDSKGKTALIYAIENNQVEIVKMLIQNGAQTTIICKAQKNILNYAAELEDKTVFNYLTGIRKIRKQFGGRNKVKSYLSR